MVDFLFVRAPEKEGIVRMGWNGWAGDSFFNHENKGMETESHTQKKKAGIQD